MVLLSIQGRRRGACSEDEKRRGGKKGSGEKIRNEGKQGEKKRVGDQGKREGERERVSAEERDKKADGERGSGGKCETFDGRGGFVESG